MLMDSILQGAQNHPQGLEEWHKASTIPLFHLEFSKQNEIIAFCKSVQYEKKETQNILYYADFKELSVNLACRKPEATVRFVLTVPQWKYSVCPQICSCFSCIETKPLYYWWWPALSGSNHLEGADRFINASYSSRTKTRGGGGRTILKPSAVIVEDDVYTIHQSPSSPTMMEFCVRDVTLAKQNNMKSRTSTWMTAGEWTTCKPTDR